MAKIVLNVGINNLLHEALAENIDTANNNHSCIQSIVIECAFSHLHNNTSSTETKLNSVAIKQCLELKCETSWSQQFSTSEKLCTYSKFEKDIFKFEKIFTICRWP